MKHWAFQERLQKTLFWPIFTDLKTTIFKHSSTCPPIAAHQLSYDNQLAALYLLTPAAVGSALLNTQQPPTSCQPAVWKEPSEQREAMLLGATLSLWDKSIHLFCCSQAHTVTYYVKYNSYLTLCYFVYANVYTLMHVFTSQTPQLHPTRLREAFGFVL